MSAFLSLDPTLENYWRSVILFGQNVASYKFALAKSLIELSGSGTTSITLEQLAEPFSRNIVEHLENAPKQATSKSSKFLDACKRFGSGELGKDELIGQTAKHAFGDVIDRFHIVNGDDIPVQFYRDDRKTGGGITLTDDLFRLAERIQYGNLPHEVEARWRLVETAWELGVNRAALAIGVEGDLLVVNGNRRKALTGCRDALNGYQKGKCFYCFDDIAIDNTSPRLADVDHFIPRMMLQTGITLPLDGVWNLVLACRLCNRGVDGKSSRIPHPRLLERLDTRNEFFIGSHHPLRETLLAQTGATRQQRTAYLKAVYRSSSELLNKEWEPKSEYEPAF